MNFLRCHSVIDIERLRLVIEFTIIFKRFDLVDKLFFALFKGERDGKM
jgi:hypothetical protein